MVTSTRVYALRVNFITRVYLFQNIHKSLLCTVMDFTRRLASETNIFRLDLSVATRIYMKKGLVEALSANISN